MCGVSAPSAIIVPRQESINLVDLVVSDAAEDVGDGPVNDR
jgi:hypothetical protein